MSDQQAVKVRTELISVSNKTGLVEFGRSLVKEFGINIISTGGTLKTLKEAKVNAIEISEFTDFPEFHQILRKSRKSLAAPAGRGQPAQAL